MRDLVTNHAIQQRSQRILRALGVAIMGLSLAVIPSCGLGGDQGEIKPKEQSFTYQKKIVQPSFGKMPMDDATQAREVPEKIRENKNSNRIVVYKIQLPFSAFSNNDKIWRIVDEDYLESQTSLMLAQNGIRAAVISQNAWPAVSKILQGFSAWTERFICRIDSGIAVELMMRSSIDQQTVFYIDRDLNLQGRSFNQCDNKFRMILSRTQDDRNFIISLEPVVSSGTTQIVRRSGDMTPTPDQIRNDQSFENLRLTATIKPEQALILSPTHMKDSPFSIGARFLADADGTPPSETILVFVPQK